MELYELHVLRWQAGAQNHRTSIAGACVRRGTREVRAAIAAGRENYLVRAESMQPPRREVNRDDTTAGTVLHDQIDSKVLDVELGIVLQ